MAPLQKDEHDEKFALARNHWQGMDEVSRMRRRAIDQVEEQSRLQRQGRTGAPEDAERTRHDEDQAGATEANTNADGSSDSDEHSSTSDAEISEGEVSTAQVARVARAREVRIIRVSEQQHRAVPPRSASLPVPSSSTLPPGEPSTVARSLQDPEDNPPPNVAPPRSSEPNTSTEGQSSRRRFPWQRNKKLQKHKSSEKQ
ncbi:hypothetical protein KC318_g823 [Hortaea werneckii]|nr:hypothetical protein KC334_g2611 [Hortaea werneckii]KAI6918436.1 hypothetical protein KC355_g17467 [Hortaea werneckii]KAI7191023.1 hypothetical protein KC324_g5844 [Hortaea werneckii]KAI7590479.1 hypothetical protein KC316_g3363 [Hortaea werneckii]KAI7675628.1 hypothetical protein KC318_g823 [Hortaea werneckii]